MDGSYSSRLNPIAKCAVAAMRAGYSMFAVQDGGKCAASATAPQTFDKFGKSTACKADGEGGPSTNQVYLFKGETIKLKQLLQSLSLTTLNLYPAFIAFNISVVLRWCHAEFHCFSSSFRSLKMHSFTANSYYEMIQAFESVVEVVG